MFPPPPHFKLLTTKCFKVSKEISSFLEKRVLIEKEMQLLNCKDDLMRTYIIG